MSREKCSHPPRTTSRPDVPARAALSDATRARALALLYLLLALPLAIRLAVVTPPFQVADEGAHLLRATQVGQGGLVAGHWAGAFLGGKLPANAAAASRPP